MSDHEQEPQEEFSFKNYFIPLTNLKAIHFIIIIGLVVFFNGLFNGFVGDDFLQIIENPVIQSFQNFPTFFSGGTFYNGGGQKLAGAFYRPVTATLFSIIYTFFGPNAFAFHFALILIYILNASLLFLIFKQFFKNNIAFILSLIFLVHPINSETALYVSDTQEVLFFFFGITALLILQRYKSKKSFLLVSILLFFSLLSKETGILFTIMSIVYVFIFTRKYIYRLLLFLLPIVVIYMLLRISAIGIFTKTIANAPIEKLDLITRLFNMPAIFLFYVKTFIFPLQLSSSYQWVYTQINFNHFFLPLIIDLIIIAILGYFAFYIYKRHLHKFASIYIFFLIWFFFGMLAHLQIIPLDKTVAVRWFYFPIVGLVGMIGVLIEVFNINLKNKWFFVFLSVIIILLSARTIVRTFDYRNEFTLTNHDIAVSKDAYDLEYNLSYVYFQEGQFENAKIHAQRSINLFPNTGNYTSLGVADFSSGDYKDARDAFLKALHYGDYYQTYDDLAGLALFYGDPHTNIKFIKNNALTRYPQDGGLWLDLSILDYKYGDKNAAKVEIQQAYSFERSSLVNYIYYIIMNNKPLNLKFKNGQMTFN